MTAQKVTCGCDCGSGPKLIFACSGAADVGAVSDQAARQLTSEGVGKMFCLAGIGGRVSGIMETTKAASAILAIDGCSLSCAKKSLEEAGFNTFAHLCLADIDMKKGETEVSEGNIAKVAERAGELIREVTS